MKRILVLGSLNIDLVQRVPRLPVPGETLKGSDLQIFVGGKGANQACAASILGGDVRMAGKVGDDVFADRLLRELQNARVDITLIEKAESASGSALICVLPNGENTIIISPGANALVSPDYALAAVASLEAGDYLLCQLEVPLKTVTAALQTAFRNQVTTILDPAPACALPNNLLSTVSILTPNQTEAAILLGETIVPESLEQAETAAIALQAQGANTVIVKLGAQGCLVAEGGRITHQSGFIVDAVDTTAAGDTFNGALVAALVRGDDILNASRFANAAAALSVTKAGAIASIPSLSSVHQLLSRSTPAL